jgi:hypothetical protein
LGEDVSDELVSLFLYIGEGRRNENP